MSGSLDLPILAVAPATHVHSFGRLENAVLMPYVDVGRGARLTNVVVDRGVRIPPRTWWLARTRRWMQARFRRYRRRACA